MLTLAACGPGWPLRVPMHTAGQIPDDYASDPARALVVARIDVITEGQPGFGPIRNPMLLRFDAGEGVPKDKIGDLTTPDFEAQSVLSLDAENPPAEANEQPLWRYAAPGLLAMSLRPGAYDALAVFYPDTLRLDRPVDSIPSPSKPLIFAPLRISPASIVYIGDIQVKQSISWSDLIFDRVRMDYAVLDRYEQTIADFRVRYPQFGNAVITKHLVTPIAHDS